LEEAAEHAGLEVWTEFDGNILLIVCDPRGILEMQLRPQLIHLLNSIVILINYIKNVYYLLILKTEDQS
jgi:hypothetical protein